MPSKQKEPFFYILQPKINFPEANMQETFSFKKENQKELNSSSIDSLGENINLEENRKLPEGQPDKQNEELTLDAEEATEVIINYQNESTENNKDSKEQANRKHSSSFNRVKSFKEMNTIERLDYLVHFPKQLPPVPCIFDTENKSVRGTLIGKMDELIEIKLFNGETVELHIETIKEVKMIGLIG
ncbi:CotO family spore coat protein [Bacillus sp. S/N-304-OC-R1]|uniref:CotO family spore coat protein n=1 Tax=Bacillus sp. S/N-304-OC-R1 TaxID=2758034 RepID=UPI001C8EE5B9|nr:CotO family spore coat protein [Bacillus sp. S/N-304-OC-R1]MBY0121001.1 hypothetical protein [Bacillus sp. S/N-304-OC-R1]